MLGAINNARVVTTSGVEEGALVVLEDGRIAGVSSRNETCGGETLDAGGGYVLPGLVDLHSDAIEQQLSPRPKVRFPYELAFLEMDRTFSSAGITTAFHGVSLMEIQRRSVSASRALFDAIVGLRGEGSVRHEAHVRCELPQEGTVEAVEELLPSRSVGLVSLTDHTPGQGQFRDLEAYRRNMREYHREDEAAVEAQIALAEHRGIRAALDRVERVARAAEEHGAVLASHDDDTPEKVRLVAERGAKISEFPINAGSAAEARRLGLAVTMGAPNVVLGRSATGNLSAVEAVRRGLVDALCSDYHPPSMLQAAFKLAREGVLSLPEAVALVSSGPARAVGLSDRGEIREGALADLIVVGERFGLPAVTHAVVGGRLVMAAPDAHEGEKGAGRNR